MNNKTRIITAIFALMLALTSLPLISCSDSSKGDMSAPEGNYAGSVGDKYDYDIGYDHDNGFGYDGEFDGGYDAPEAPADKPSGGMPGGSGSSAVTDRKRIEYITIHMETLNYDRTVAELKARTAAAGGYIDSSEENGKSIYGAGSRSATFTLRIPASESGAFSESVSDLGTVLSQNVNSDDVTNSYFDIEARLASLEMQRDKYMELLDSAVDMYAIVELTNALTNTIYEIESLTTTLRRYDSLIAYSTVTVYVNEVIETTKAPEEVTFGSRIADAFSGSIDAFVSVVQGVVIAFIAAIPFLVIPAVIIVVIVIIVAVKRRKHK